jgi:hypothetical protein
MAQRDAAAIAMGSGCMEEGLRQRRHGRRGGAQVIELSGGSDDTGDYRSQMVDLAAEN